MNILPQTDAVKRSVDLPILLNVFPGCDNTDDVLHVRLDELQTCRVCKSYLTSHCKVLEGKWECSICMNENTLKESEISQLQRSRDIYDVVVKSREELGPIYAVYLSLNFSNLQNFENAKKQCVAVLENLPPNGKGLVFIGMETSPFAILVPPKIVETEGTISAPFSSGFVVDDRISQVAAIARFASFEAFIGLDLANFFFEENNTTAGKNILMKLRPTEEKNPIEKALQMTGTLSKVLNGTPLRFFAFVETVQRETRFFEMLRPFPVRVDLMVACMTQQAHAMKREIPGTVSEIEKEDPIIQMQKLMKQRTKYQFFAKCRARKAAVEWKSTDEGFTEAHEHNFFAPVCFDDQSFELNVNILPNRETFVFQLTSRFLVVGYDRTDLILRVISREYETSDDVKKILESARNNNQIPLLD